MKEQVGLLKINQKGQAVVEYILALVIIVSIILLISIKFFKPLQGYVNDTLGIYVQCLLETGELPNLHSGEASTECTLSNLGGSGGQFGPNAANSKNNGKGNNDKNNSEKNGSNRNSDNSGGSGGSGGGGAYNGYAGSRGGSLFSRRGAQVTENNSKDGKTVEIALNDSGGGGFFRVSNSVGGYGSNRTSRPNITRELTNAQQKELKEKNRTNKSSTVEGETRTPSPKKILVKPPPAPKILEQEDEKITFGNYFRYFLIAAIIIIILLIIGGQAMQLSKSWEK